MRARIANRELASLQALARAHGEAGKVEAPFAWLPMEPPPNNVAVMELRISVLAHGANRRLATTRMGPRRSGEGGAASLFKAAQHRLQLLASLNREIRR